MGVSVPPDVLRDIAEFMGVFADQCHHGKEEAHLFQALGRKGIPMRGCPVGALTAEHEAGRGLMRAFSEAAEAYINQGASAKGPLIDCLKKLTELYPGHIWKEDYLLFPMTNKVLGPAEQEELASRRSLPDWKEDVSTSFQTSFEEGMAAEHRAHPRSLQSSAPSSCQRQGAGQ
jgi:hemerythrin-like domain-containing protein